MKKINRIELRRYGGLSAVEAADETLRLGKEHSL
jgi:hypothetical protein